MKKIFFWLFTIFICLIVTETSSYLIIKFNDKIPSLKEFEDYNNYSLNEACTNQNIFKPSPFLGYTAKSIESCGFKVNRNGFSSREFPLTRDKNAYSILITGGSVARNLTIATTDSGDNSIENFLNSNLISPNNKKIVVYSSALDGFRQPQQLATITHFSYFSNLVIDISGFNETGNYSKERGPISNETFNNLVFNKNDYRQGIINFFLKYNSSFLYKNMNTPFLLFYLCFTNNKHADMGSHQGSFAEKNNLNLKEVIDFHSKKHRYYIALSNSIALQNKSNFLQIIQPNFFKKKVYGPTEKVSLKLLNNNTANDYRYLLKTSSQIMSSVPNVKTLDLSDLFSNIKENIFVDLVHFNDVDGSSNIDITEGQQMILEALKQKLITNFNFRSREK